MFYKSIKENKQMHLFHKTLIRHILLQFVFDIYPYRISLIFIFLYQSLKHLIVFTHVQHTQWYRTPSWVKKELKKLDNNRLHVIVVKTVTLGKASA